jgi:hypothetical protein
MAYGAAIVAAIAAVGSLAVTAVSSADTARRAQHAAEDQADYNTKVLVPMENARRDAMLEQSRRQRAQSIAALRVNAGKATGGKISDDTTAACGKRLLYQRWKVCRSKQNIFRYGSGSKWIY